MTVGVLMAPKEKFKALRTAAKLTQQALAMKAGLSMSAVIHLEAGRIPDPRLSTARAIAEALGVTLDELAAALDDADQPDEPPPGPKRRRKKGGGE